MNTLKRLGICMDHSIAHLMEFKTGHPDTITIESKFTHLEKEQSIAKSEILMHNKQQHQQSEYYKKLGEAIKNFDEVLLFGPTDAKVELFNLLRADHIFAKIKINVEQTDKMSDHQQQTFVREHFSKE
jgi:hypothetical protein